MVRGRGRYCNSTQKLEINQVPTYVLMLSTVILDIRALHSRIGTDALHVPAS